jgi:hypothetical protein
MRCGGLNFGLLRLRSAQDERPCRCQFSAPVRAERSPEGEVEA